MSAETPKFNAEEQSATRVDITTPGWRASIVGPALAVITVVALLGAFWLAGKVVDLSEKALLRPGPGQSIAAPEQPALPAR